MQTFDIPLLQELLEALHRSGLRYCHFKSNEGLGRAIRGETDFDLLVDGGQKLEFSRLVVRLGFKKTRGRWDRRFPGIVHFVGLDLDTGSIVDLHVHFRLIVGSDLLKNYALPVAPYLDSAIETQHSIRVPAVEYEYVLFVVRMVLKRRLLSWVLGHPDPRIVVRTLAAGRHPGLRESEARELAYLLERIDAEKVASARAELVPEVDDDLFALCEQSIGLSADRLSWVRAGWRLTRALQAHRRVGRWRSAGRALAVRYHILVPGILRRLRIRTRPNKLKLTCRGPVVAFVGGDGSGKTTNVEALHESLGQAFAVRMYHLGKPPKGPVRLGFMVASKAMRIAMGNRRESDVRPLLAMRYVLIARGRLKLVRSLHAYADRGGIVICDRYPLAALELSEGPLVGTLGGGLLMTRLAALEQRYYARIARFPEPNMVFVLSIDPAIAICRRPEDDPDFIRPRLEEIRDRAWDRVRNAHVIDSSRPLESVLADVRSAAWKALPDWVPHVEISGPAGAGKSTLTEHLLTVAAAQAFRIPTVRTWKVRSALALATIPLAVFRVGAQKTRWIVTKQVLLDVWARRLPTERAPVIYDQGPYFTLAFAGRILGSALDDPFVRQWHRRYAEQASHLIDLVVRVDAEDAVLIHRLTSRSQAHMVKAATEAEQLRFVEASRHQLDEVLTDDWGDALFSVIKIQSDEADPAALASAVLDEIGVGD